MTPFERVLAAFGTRKQATVIQALPPVRSVVMDTIYPEPSRSQYESAMVPVGDIVAVTRTVPVVSRNGRAVSIAGESSSGAFIAPLAVNPSDFIGAADLNNLMTLQGIGLDAWQQRKTQRLRDIVRATTEGIAATSITGTITWPLRLEGGGWDTYRIEFGAPIAYDPADKWDGSNADAMTVFICLSKIKSLHQANGYGGQLEFWAAEDVFARLLGLVAGWKSTAKLRVEIAEEGVYIGGFLVKLRGETYFNPQTETQVPVVSAGRLCAISMEAGHRLFYCAVDDLDARLLPWPFFIKPVKTDNPSGIELIAHSKPLPVPNYRAISWSTVLGGGA